MAFKVYQIVGSETVTRVRQAFNIEIPEETEEQGDFLDGVMDFMLSEKADKACWVVIGLAALYFFGQILRYLIWLR